jgi:Ca2+-binding RTX toxin-like protein
MHNVIDSGAGMDFLYGGLGADAFVVTAPGTGMDQIWNFSLFNHDTLDLRQALSGSSWNGDFNDLDDFVSASISGRDTILSISPSGTQGGSSVVAELHNCTASFSDLLAHNALVA